jgi:hypothetical protein
MAGLAQPAPMAKFAIQITVSIKDDRAPQSFCLGKDANGAGVSNITDAAACIINSETQFVCAGKTITSHEIRVDGFDVHHAK